MGDKADGDVLTFEFEPRDKWYTNGSTLTRYYTSNPGVHVPLRFTFDVAFDPEGPAIGQPLLTMLGTLMMVTWMVLLAFEERFFATSIPHSIPPPLEGRAEYIGTDSFAERTGWRQGSAQT